MIQFKKGTYNLNKLITTFTEYGNSKIFELSAPDKLRIGRNEIRIRVNSNILLKESDVFIDIFDSEQNSIYYRISSIANEDLTRSIIVYIYKDTPVGSATIYISGTTADEKIYLFVKNLTISNQINSQPIKFEIKPEVTYRERLEAVRAFQSKRELINNYSSGGSISIISRISPKNIQRDTLSIEVPELSNFDSTNRINNNIGVSSFNEIPRYFENSILTSKNFVFSSSMAGGMIYANNISLPYPNNASSSSPFSNISYSASILNVINSSSIEVFPPFNKNISYIVNDGTNSNLLFDRFYNHTNFTTSFYEILQLSSSVVTQSYAVLDVYNLEPDSGNVDSIKVSYKPLNVFGNDFQPLGSFEVPKYNILADSSSIYFDNELGLIERPIGIFRNGLSDFRTYWVTQSFGTGSIVTATSTILKEGIRISYPSTRSLTDYHYFKPNQGYFAGKNTEFELSIDTISETDYSRSFAQMDIYISGSDIKNNPNISKKLPYELRKSSSFGTYIGSISDIYGEVQNNTFNFITKNSSNIVPTFVIQTGIWNFGNIQLNSRNEPGFNTNQTRIYVPLNDVRSKTELSLRIDYENAEKNSSNWFTILDKVFYRGTDDSKLNTILLAGSASKKIYMDETTISLTPLATNPIPFSFPIFRDNFENPYTGSKYHVGLLYEIKTMFFAYSGSFSGSLNTYVFAATSQGRGSVNSFDSSGAPFIYNSIHISGSSNFTLGTFGSGGANSISKPNLDSWLTVFSHTAIAPDSVGIIYNIIPTGSIGTWTVNAVSTCEVQKYEQKYA